MTRCRYRQLAVFLTIACLAGGCADLGTPPSWVPFRGGYSDHVAGVTTPAERIKQFKQLASQGSATDPARCGQVVKDLTVQIRAEKDPLIRAEILRAVAEYRCAESDRVLRAALNDSDCDVRSTACEAFGKRGGATAVETLTGVVREDPDVDVRLAAIRALGNIGDRNAIPVLGEVLDDKDPAMQYRAILALKEITGEDLGNEVGPWRQYARGETPSKPQGPSVAQRLRGWVPFF